MSIFLHEQLYRSATVMAKLRQFPVTVCGAGALGANLTENLARSGFENLKVIDRDRIEERNLSTQPYYRSDIGAFKAKILGNHLYRAIGVKIATEAKELTAQNAKKLLPKTGVVLDTFDNSLSRQVVTDYCQTENIPCLHVGLASDYAEAIWNDRYRVPSPAQDDICDYPLARNLVLIAVAVAADVLIDFIETEKKESYTITLSDFAVKSLI